MSDCIFCLISKGVIKSKKLFSNENCFIIEDISPKAPIHLLIIPHEHILRLSDSTSLVTTLGSIVDTAVNYVKEIGVIDDGYRLIINQGDNSGQEVPHLHLHLLAGRKLLSMG